MGSLGYCGFATWEGQQNPGGRLTPHMAVCWYARKQTTTGQLKKKKNRFTKGGDRGCGPKTRVVTLARVGFGGVEEKPSLATKEAPDMMGATVPLVWWDITGECGTRRKASLGEGGRKILPGKAQDGEPGEKSLIGTDGGRYFEPGTK